NNSFNINDCISFPKIIDKLLIKYIAAAVVVDRVDSKHRSTTCRVGGDMVNVRFIVICDLRLDINDIGACISKCVKHSETKLVYYFRCDSLNFQ
ncbi:hypothetical protein BLOT_003465, partial [Blomia tropicalis]